MGGWEDDRMVLVYLLATAATSSSCNTKYLS